MDWTSMSEEDRVTALQQAELLLKELADVDTPLTLEQLTDLACTWLESWSMNGDRQN